jgi:hypothetical protein
MKNRLLTDTINGFCSSANPKSSSSQQKGH